MANNRKSNIASLIKKLTAPEILALLGFLLYLTQAIIFAHSRMTDLDEGSYLYKGYLLATGQQSLFAPYGLWLNKMYLSFFVWGWIQQFFDPGLLAPRSFAVVFSVLSLIGVWIVARRMGNSWLATLAVWVLALNPTLISIYSRAISQVLIFCIFTWILVFSLGEKRPCWQIIMGSILAALMTLTRENMVFVLPLFIIYIFWQHGRRNGLISFATIVVIVLSGHLIFWPDIMRLWTKWLPDYLLPFLDQTAKLDSGISLWDNLPASPIFPRMLSLSHALRIYLIPITGSIFLLLLWPKKTAWQSMSHFRAAVFLASLFFFLLITHAWASLGKNYCIFCFQNYIAFFSVIGLLLIIISIRSWNKSLTACASAGVIITIITTTTAVGFSLFEHVGDLLLTLPVPRFRDGRILPGWATLWQLLNNKFHIEYADARQFTPAAAGLLLGFSLLLLFFIIYFLYKRHNKLNYFYFAANCFLVSFFLSSPLLTWPYDEPICKNDVITSYEIIGKSLDQIISPQSKIYIDGTLTNAVLLYGQDAEILLPQLNDTYSYRIGGNPDQVLQRGFWNEEIAQSWRDSSDIFVIESKRMSAWKDYLRGDNFSQVPLPDNLFSCSNGEMNIYIFKRN